jgi:4'-phosphopantetheinyl transferase EntD
VIPDGLGVEAEDCFDDPPGLPMWPEEAAIVAGAVAVRRSEFTTVRHCARTALARLGVPAGPILPGARGAPIWATGVVGSMTHCRGYRAAAVARASDAAAIGIDAEPHVPLPSGVERLVARAGESDHLRQLAALDDTVHWDTLLFSAKECLYKVWFPLMGEWLGFEQAEIQFRPEIRTFEARLHVAGPVLNGRPVQLFSGQFHLAGGLVLLAIVVPSSR